MWRGACAERSGVRARARLSWTRIAATGTALTLSRCDTVPKMYMCVQRKSLNRDVTRNVANSNTQQTRRAENSIKPHPKKRAAPMRRAVESQSATRLDPARARGLRARGRKPAAGTCRTSRTPLTAAAQCGGFRGPCAGAGRACPPVGSLGRRHARGSRRCVS